MKIIKLLLIPIQLVYFFVSEIRNILYDKRILKINFVEPIVISIGNLQLGGTGKTPLVEYIIRLLNKQKIAIISRGYKRQTKQFIRVKNKHSSLEVGDEMRQLKHKFKNTNIACDINRFNGVKQILKHEPETQIILLDDAYQHRNLHRNLDIVLTEYDDIYINDRLFPLGRLREHKKNIKRADLIIVTKCPKSISKKKQETIRFKLQPSIKQKIYFSYISNYNFIEKQNSKIIQNKEQLRHLLITGIANHKPLLGFLKEGKLDVKHIAYPDHHYFNNNDIQNLINLQKTYSYSNKLLMTEKDFYRLSQRQIQDIEKYFKIIYIQIKIDFIDGDKHIFNNQLLNFKNLKNK